ncbi:septin family protein [Desarmillaria tabescens]|uniref:Septin family protein n=1 Tax=Armillaria tabescens TaxID=1929756 RepID=A0AA39NER3_ARMTA|nr:septin family protein [Desarmillaria tabescens]KAK0464274.1 septin family protein [Desarmillaria tabescens]
MFSLRRKSTKPVETPRIRGSPSLPELNPQGIPWPEDLVDINSIRDDQPPVSPTHNGPAKTSFGMEVHSPIPFHKPFRSPGKPAEGGPISSLYMTPHPPSAFRTTKYSQRRARLPPTFNLMVVGGQGTGKTSLLRLLLETADISPAATVDQRAAVDQFLRGAPKATQDIHTACVEICESRFDRMLLSVIDTPGLDFVEGRELKLERQVSGVLKYVDAQYSDTMSEESKVIRKSKGDQHIHLCIYMIHPSSIMTVAARRAQSSLPIRTRSEATVSQRTPPDLVPDTSSGDDSDDEGQAALTMSPAEIRVIRRLSARVNVLPVISHADSLTDDKLAAVKAAIHNDLADAGLGFGVFSHGDEPETPKKRRAVHTKSQTEPNGTSNGRVADESEGEEEGERQSRPIIKLRSSRHSSTPRAISRSRSRRRDLSVAADDHRRPVSPDLDDKESVANVRFSAAVVAKSTADLASLMPFALIAPESTKNRHRGQLLNTAPSSPVPSSEDGHSPSIDMTVSSVPHTPASLSGARNPTFLGPPEDLKGVFVRKFRWGTVDVLDPNHCDFAALRTAVLSTHLNVLKTHTKEVLYEKYRTEKLLARRATRQITDGERDRLLEDGIVTSLIYIHCFMFLSFIPISFVFCFVYQYACSFCCTALCSGLDG